MSSGNRSRGIVEKNRRNQMKNLCSQLNSLVPHQGSSSGESMTLPDQIDEATNYIRKLQEDVGRLKERRETLRGVDDGSNSHSGAVQIKVNEMEGALEVTLVTGLEFQFVFNEVIRILHEENAEVLNASYSAVDGTVFHTIHAQIGEDASSYAAARISERLNQFAL
uniref:BHLH domain-containing protein n=1 Tax=Opuntia streptacantha TaxID=393608 RepID=A0A7C9DKF9_OPUST